MYSVPERSCWGLALHYWSIRKKAIKQVGLSLLVLLPAVHPLFGQAAETRINFGYWHSRASQMLLEKVNATTTPGARIDMLSAGFLGTPYRRNTLTPPDSAAEQLVIDLQHVDCLTFLEYVEALRDSPVLQRLPSTLPAVRYYNGAMSYRSRKHFFSDWLTDTQRVVDVSGIIAGPYVGVTTRALNSNKASWYFLPGIQSRTRQIQYVPTPVLLRQPNLSHLQIGDYLGLLSDRPDLDVTHVGIAVRNSSGDWLFRHASARPRVKRVVDLGLAAAVQHTLGVMVLRPIARSKPLDLPP